MPVVLITPEELASANKALHELGEKRWLGELSQRVSAGGMKFVADGFNTSTNPYDEPCSPLKHPRARDKRAAARKMRRAARIAGSLGGGLGGTMMSAFGGTVKGAKVLIDTSRMRSSAGASPRGRIARIVIPTWYAAVHQKGGFVPAHSRLARFQNETYRVGGRFADARTAARAHRAGKLVHVDRWRRTYSQGIRIPQRMMLPDEDRGLPEKWNTMMETEADKLLWQKFGVRR